MMIDKTWFKNYQKLATKVNNSDGGKEKVEGIGDVDVEARDTLKKFCMYQSTKQT